MSEYIAYDIEENFNDFLDVIKDNYVFCPKCATFVCEFCSLHGAQLVIPDTEIQGKSCSAPRAVLTIPHTFLHLAPSFIPGAGLGVFSSTTIPCGVRFGPYAGRKIYEVNSAYCWKVNPSKNSAYIIDAGDANNSNWMRYVNCARHFVEQNLVASQYKGQIYYRTIKIIPRYTELLVFYGSEYANRLDIDLRNYNEQCFPRCLEHINNGENNEQDFTDYEASKEEVNTYNNKQNSLYNLKNKYANCDVGNRILNKNVLDKNLSNEFLTIFNNERGNYNLPDTTKNVFMCEKCQKSFDKKYKLENHKLVHLDYRRYSCTYCDFKTNRRANINDHINCQHIKSTVYTCNICKKNLYTKRSLQKHKKIHSKSQIN